MEALPSCRGSTAVAPCSTTVMPWKHRAPSLEATPPSLAAPPPCLAALPLCHGSKCPAVYCSRPAEKHRRTGRTAASQSNTPSQHRLTAIQQREARRRWIAGRTAAGCLDLCHPTTGSSAAPLLRSPLPHCSEVRRPDLAHGGVGGMCCA
jgi:hypothetical protein